MQNFDWNQCVSNFTEELCERIATERGFQVETLEGLLRRSLVGCCYVAKWHSDAIAFPIYDEEGNVIRAHCRCPKRNENGKVEWAYEPEKDLENRPITPLVFGDPTTATKVFLFESNMDALALIDRLGLFDEIDSGEICIVITRGATSAGNLKRIKWSGSGVIYACPQTDSAGQRWLASVIEILGGCYAIKIPPPHKDLGDWIRAPDFESTDLEWAIDNSEFANNAKSQAESKKDSKQQEDEERALAFGQAITKGSKLLKIKLPPKKVIIDDWYKEGDLGFIFAYRGAGKTWLTLALCVALADSGKCGPWQVQGKWPVLYVDGEMSHDDDKNRISGLQHEIPEELCVLNHEVLFHLHQLVMNLGNRIDQEIITKICMEKGIKVLVLDNLGCLFSGVGENDADEWEKILPWLLELRRHAISVIIVHHSGHDSTRMRGTVKREDSAAWVLRLDDQREDYSEAGAKFISRFRKLRGNRPVPDYEWRFEPNGSDVLITFKETDRADAVLQWVRDGLTHCEAIAREMGLSNGTISKLATKLIKEGKLAKKGREYVAI